MASNLPPGCTLGDIERQATGPEPSPESERVLELIEAAAVEPFHPRAVEKSWQATKDHICEIVDGLAVERAHLRWLLQLTLRHLPHRGMPPQCLCMASDADVPYCPRHDGEWDLPILREMVEEELAK